MNLGMQGEDGAAADVAVEVFGTPGCCNSRGGGRYLAKTTDAMGPKLEQLEQPSN